MSSDFTLNGCTRLQKEEEEIRATIRLFETDRKLLHTFEKGGKSKETQSEHRDTRKNLKDSNYIISVGGIKIKAVSEGQKLKNDLLILHTALFKPLL